MEPCPAVFGRPFALEDQPRWVKRTAAQAASSNNRIHKVSRRSLLYVPCPPVFPYSSTPYRSSLPLFYALWPNSQFSASVTLSLGRNFGYHSVSPSMLVYDAISIARSSKFVPVAVDRQVSALNRDRTVNQGNDRIIAACTKLIAHSRSYLDGIRRFDSSESEWTINCYQQLSVSFRRAQSEGRFQSEAGK